MKKPTGLLEHTGEGLEDLNEWIFTELEKKKNEENREYREIEEKLLALEGIAQDILSNSSWNLTGKKDDPHLLFVKYLKNQILVHYLLIKEIPSHGLITMSRFQAKALQLAQEYPHKELYKWHFGVHDMAKRMQALEDMEIKMQALEQYQMLGWAQELVQELKKQIQEQEQAMDLIKKRAQVLIKQEQETTELDQMLEWAQEMAQEWIKKLKKRAQEQDLPKILDQILEWAQELAQMLELTQEMAKMLELTQELRKQIQEQEQAMDLIKKRAQMLAQEWIKKLETTLRMIQNFIKKSIPFKHLDLNVNLFFYVPDSIKKSAEIDLVQDKLLNNSYFRLNYQYSTLDIGSAKDTSSLFEGVLSSFLETIQAWDKSDLIEHRKTLLDTSLQFIPEYIAQHENLDKNKAHTRVEETEAKYLPVNTNPQFDKEAEWEMVITIPGDFHRASDIGKLVLTFAEGLETIPGVEVSLVDIIQGSLIARLRIRFRDFFAKEGTKEVLKETARLAVKGKQAAEDQYLSKPIEEVGKLKAERTKTERETYSEDEAQELKRLQIAKLREEVTEKRLKNIKSAAELMKEGMLPIGDLQVNINEVLFIKKVNNKLEVNESWEEKLDQADGEIEV